ncbi:MAG: hypothetical protein ACRAS9_01780 [Mycoplasma sp.]
MKNKKLLTQKQINLYVLISVAVVTLIFFILWLADIVHYSWILGGLLGGAIGIVRGLISRFVIDIFIKEAKIRPKSAKHFYWMFVFFNLIFCGLLLLPIVLLPDYFNLFGFLIEISIIIIIIIVLYIFDEQFSQIGHMNTKDEESITEKEYD